MGPGYNRIKMKANTYSITAQHRLERYEFRMAIGVRA